MESHQAIRVRHAHRRWVLLLAAVTFISCSSHCYWLPRSRSRTSESTLPESCWTYKLSVWQGKSWKYKGIVRPLAESQQCSGIILKACIGRKLSGLLI